MKSALATVEARDVVCCGVAAYGAVRAGAALIAAWRRQPPLPPGWSLPANFLKNSDPQTIAGLVALYRALERHDSPSPNSQDWGVIGAPCLLGRSALAMSCQRFAVEGAWAISPNLIPHHSLHALSGTISQALNLRGPNFGVGGGNGATAEGFIMAATLLANRSLPGLWLVLTGFEPELLPVDPSQPADTTPTGPEPQCDAVALALIPGEDTGAGLTLRIGREVQPPAHSCLAPSQPHLTRLRLPLLQAALAAPDFEPPYRWRLDTGGWIELTE